MLKVLQNHHQEETLWNKINQDLTTEINLKDQQNLTINDE